VFEKVVQPACEGAGLQPVWTGNLANPGEINEQICRHLRDDDVVVADVTDANPNVMYELGLRHTRSLLTIQIGERGRLPFDISVIRTVRFIRTDYGLIEARNDLTGVLNAGLAGEWDPVTPTRIWNEITSPVPASEPAAAASSEEPGFLEQLASMEQAMPQLIDELESVGGLLQQMGQLATDYAPRMQNAPTSAAKLLLANQFADHLGPHAETLEDRVGSYADAVSQASPGVSYLLGRIQSGPLTADEIVSAGGLLRSLVAAGEASQQGTASLGVLADVVSTLGAASRRLREPTARVSRSLRRMVDATSIWGTWAERARTLLATRPEFGLPPQP